MRALAALLLLTLAACGADGDPEPVKKPGVSVTAEARIGVSGTF